VGEYGTVEVVDVVDLEVQRGLDPGSPLWWVVKVTQNQLT
jgi:hypothetical protein